MALVDPTNKLATQTVAGSFDQLLYVDAASGLEEATLRTISTDSTKSALQLCGEKVLIKSAETEQAAAFAVQSNGSTTNIFSVDGSTAGTLTLGTVTVGSAGDGHDVTFYGDTSGKHLLWDQSADELALIGNGTKLSFYDANGGENISADGSGVLSIVGGSEIDLTATAIDINGTVDISGTLTVGGNIDFNSSTIDLSTQSVGVSLNSATNALNFDSNTLVIDASNNIVGIGTATPDAALEIERTSTQLKLSYDGSNYASFDVASDGLLTITTADDAEADIILSPAGNVGIGTATPGADLHIEKDATTGTAPLEVLRLDVKDAGVDLDIGMGPKLSFYTPHDSASFEGAAIAAERMSDNDTYEPVDMSFFTAADGPNLAEKMRITSAGYLGIGTKTPDGKLELSQDSADCNLIVTTYDDDSSEYSSLILRKSDGTEADTDLIHDDDILGAIRFEGLDNDSGGIFLPGAEIIARINGTPNDNVMPCDLEFWTNTGGTAATQRMTIYEGGNVNIPGSVGIGTATSPSELLHLKSATAAGIFIEADTDNSSQEDAYIKLSADNTSAVAEFAISSNAGDRITGGISANVTILGSETNDPVQLFTNNTARLNILANGKVGIGINAPDATLHVHTATAGSVVGHEDVAQLVLENNSHSGMSILSPNGYQKAIYFGGPASNREAEIIWDDNLDTNGELIVGTRKAASQVSFIQAGTERMRIDENGKIGIGVANPANALSVHGAVNINTTNADGNEARFILNPGGAGDNSILTMYHNDASTIGILLNAGGTTYFNTGNVAIGHDSPSYKLEVKATQASDFVCHMLNESTATTADCLKLSVGTASENLAVSGSWLGLYDAGGIEGEIRGVNGNGCLFSSVSDRRLKEDIVDIPDALSIISSLKPRNFYWKSHSGISGKPIQYGFIADEYEEVFPGTVSGKRDEDDKLIPDAVKSDGSIFKQLMDGNRYTVPVLVKAIQELSAEVDKLKGDA